jgi:3-hydroxyisobutyrate dehydrogenase-like beta-hydroxyacid dehydrogenase
VGLPKEAWFDVNMMQKDTTYALDMSKQLGMALPTAAIANQFLTAARGLGLEKEDCAVLFHVLARLSGVPA